MSTADQKTEEDAFRCEAIKTLDDPWMRCCPKFITMGIATIIGALLGFAIGVIGSEYQLYGRWMKCYDGGDTLKSCWPVVIGFGGKIWVQMLKCVISPLVVSIFTLLPRRIKGFGPVGSRVIGLLFFTSSMAAIQGLIWGNITQPGKSFSTDTGAAMYISPDDKDRNKQSELEALLFIIHKAVPKNLASDISGNQVLGLITTWTLVGYYLETDCPEQWKMPIINTAQALLRCIMNIIVLVVWFTPIGAFSIIAKVLLTMKDLSGIVESVGMYVLTQFVGQFFHLVGFYFIFFYLSTGQNPLQFFMKISKAPLTALVTSSSAATLPVTLAVNLEDKEENDTIGRRVVEFVVPMGSTINMDGTSLGFPIMVIFIDNIGKSLGGDYATEGMKFANMLAVAVMAMFSSVGTAPIPQAGLVYIMMLCDVGGITNENLQGLGLALVALFDPFVDRVETAQNVTSDSFISKIIAHNVNGGKNLFGGNRLICFPPVDLEMLKGNSKV